MEKNEGLLDQLKQRLRQRYQENIDIKRLFYPKYPLSLDACYIHLGLTQESEFESEKKRKHRVEEDSYNFDQRILHLRGFERGVTIDKTIEVAEIATTYLPEQQRILIAGPAGSGKTTLCRYVAYQWALGEESKEPWAKQFDWLFWIPLRELITLSNNSQADLVTVLRQVCFRFNATTNLLRKKDNEELFLEHLASHPQRILYLLDGYDELDLQHPTIHTLWNELQSGEQIILTTRPGRPITFNPPFKLQLAVLGLSNEQIKNYTTSFFSQAPIQSPDMAKACYEFIQANTNLWSLAHSPINLEMICSLWDQKVLNNKTDINLTDLYQLIFKSLLNRYVERAHPNIHWEDANAKQECKVYIEFMEYLAFLAMQKEEVFIQDHELINKAFKEVVKNRNIDKTFFDEIQDIGLLNFYGKGQQAEFAHLTFQEFFAARYIKKQLLTFVEKATFSLKDSKQLLEDFKRLLQLIHDKKHAPFYEVMWWFVAGLLAQKPEPPFLIDIKPKQEVLENVSSNQLKLQALQLFVDCMLQSPRHGKDELSEVCLLMRCLDEAKFPNIMQKPAIIALFQSWLDFYLKNYKNMCNLIEQKFLFRLEQIERCLGASGLLFYQQSSNRRYLRKLIESKQPELLKILTTIRIWPVLQRVWSEFENNNEEKTLSSLLLPLLRAANNDIQRATIWVVSSLGPAAHEDLQKELVSLLSNPKSDIQEEAIKAMINLGHVAHEDVQQALMSLLINKDPAIREKVIWAVIFFDRFFNYKNLQKNLQKVLVTLLKHANPTIQQKAIETIDLLGFAIHEDLQKALVPLLSHANPTIQQKVIETFGCFKEVAHEDVQKALVPLLSNANLTIQQKAIEIVGCFGLAAHEDVQKALVPLLSHANLTIQQKAIEIVGCFGLAAHEDVQRALVPLLSHENLTIQRKAIEVIGRIGKVVHEELQKALVPLLRPENLKILQGAIWAVGQQGRACSQDLQQALVPLLNHANPAIQQKAIEAVGCLGEAASLELQKALVPLIEHENLMILEAAIKAVSNLGKAASPELQKVLVPLIEHENLVIQEAAIKAVAQLSDVVQVLVSLLKHENPTIQHKAIEAVGCFNKAAHEDVQKALMPLLKHANPTIQQKAIKAVGYFKKAAHEDVQKALRPLLSHANPTIQQMAIEAVGCFKKAAHEDVQRALVPFVTSANSAIQEAALCAFEAIGQAAVQELQQKLVLLINEDSKIQQKAISLICNLKSRATKQLKEDLLQLMMQTNKATVRNAAICLATIEDDVTYLKKPFEIDTLQLPPSQVFNWIEYSITQLVPLCGEIQKPIFQNNHVCYVLTEEYSTLALVRKKGHKHVFLVLESLENSIHLTRKIELLLPDSSGSSFMDSKDVEIQITDINKPEDYIRLEDLTKNCECQIYSITTEVVEQLIHNVKADKEAKIKYHYFGDSRICRFFSLSGKRHNNCISWCLEKLEDIGIPLKRHWLDVVCVLPENYLPSTDQEISPSRCLIS